MLLIEEWQSTRNPERMQFCIPISASYIFNLWPDKISLHFSVQQTGSVGRRIFLRSHVECMYIIIFVYRCWNNPYSKIHGPAHTVHWTHQLYFSHFFFRSCSCSEFRLISISSFPSIYPFAVITNASWFAYTHCFYLCSKSKLMSSSFYKQIAR